jgi:hypothetical protein
MHSNKWNFTISEANDGWRRASQSWSFRQICAHKSIPLTAHLKFTKYTCSNFHLLPYVVKVKWNVAQQTAKKLIFIKIDNPNVTVNVLDAWLACIKKRNVEYYLIRAKKRWFESFLNQISQNEFGNRKINVRQTLNFWSRPSEITWSEFKLWDWGKML